MLSTLLPCCFFPTTIVFVDDNQKFLNRMKLETDPTRGPVITFNSPHEAIEFFKTYQPNHYTNRCITQLDEESTEHRNIDVDIRAIHEEIYNPERFNEISVLVIDYAMPGKNGLEVCRQIKDLPIKIILLTGEADEKLATQAFNDGLIHQFIRKDDPDFSKTLNNAIEELQYQYFSELSTLIIQSLPQDPEHPIQWFSDPSFIHHFHETLQKNKIVEYYLLESNGSFLLVNFDGKILWMPVRSDNQMEDFYTLAEEAEAPTSILKSLKEKKDLPFFFTDHDFETPPNEWKKYLHPAKTVKGKETYYIAHVLGDSLYQLNTNPVLSYKAFLERAA